MRNLKIGVWGLGLIGGSILKRLHEKGFYTIAVSKSSCEKSVPWATECSKNAYILKNADVVFVCSQMSKVNAALDELEDILDKKTIVADVSSLKEFVCEKERPYEFVGSHPMAGTEFSGFEHSYAELFEGAKWVLTKNNKTLEYLIAQMGAKTVIMEPQEHDRAVALVSHLPMFLAQALFKAAEDDENAKILAASGFRDMTRLAMTGPELASDMIELNQKNINKALEELVGAMAYLKKLSHDERIKALEKQRKNRTKMYDEQGKNTL